MITAMSRAGWCRRSLTIILVPLLLVAAAVRPVRISAESGSDTIWLWAWQKGKIEFVNSVTHLPVEIGFGMPWRFSDFNARTDAGTEEYYTSGEYAWNDRLARERPAALTCCSEVGMNLTLGEYRFREQGGCITVALVWPL